MCFNVDASLRAAVREAAAASRGAVAIAAGRERAVPSEQQHAAPVAICRRDHHYLRIPHAHRVPSLPTRAGIGAVRPTAARNRLAHQRCVCSLSHDRYTSIAPPPPPPLCPLFVARMPPIYVYASLVSLVIR